MRNQLINVGETSNIAQTTFDQQWTMSDKSAQSRPKNPSEVTGTVLNIQRFCYHDGPGIRTTIFLKGCSLRCQWCGNPESIHPKSELAYDAEICIGKKACGRCLKSPFPEGAFSVADGADDKITVNWNLVRDCDESVIALCPAKALFIYGKSMTANEVLDEVERDRSFYCASAGGLTLSGGEPLLQPDFCVALLAEAQQRGLNTAIETAGNVPWSILEQVLPYVDTVLHDFKLMDPALHKTWTDANNRTILDNYKRAYTQFPNIDFIARTPLIPSVNADEETIRSVLEFILPHKNVIEYELLPYHRLGMRKYELLGESYEATNLVAPSPEWVQHLISIIDEAFERKNNES